MVEFDIKAAFDQIDHLLLMKGVRKHIKEDWILLYIERWMTAPFETAEGISVPRERGTPQGGVVSPILMNLFMHYAFDHWMKRKHPAAPPMNAMILLPYSDFHFGGRDEGKRMQSVMERAGPAMA